jgi:hypothetical protein
MQNRSCKHLKHRDSPCYLFIDERDFNYLLWSKEIKLPDFAVPEEHLKDQG